jgi:hypothetical protein
MKKFHKAAEKKQAQIVSRLIISALSSVNASASYAGLAERVIK